MADIEFALQKGDMSNNGQITIVDEDRLCYLVRSDSKGAVGLRTISKALLKEFVEYFRSHPGRSSSDARNALSGRSGIDKYEYGYNSTLSVMADMVLSNEKKRVQIPKAPKTPLKSGLQIIYYGAPGTGKSFEIKKNTETAEKEGRVIRTTFHPDSDYSTFVGAYKPTTEEVVVDNAKPEKKIVYDFVPQAFLKAYTGAWKNQEEPFFLIIEEINRGNCAQIFGDLFQLLDRNDKTGLSEYPISPDEDIKKFLLTDKKYGFKVLTDKQKAAIPEEIRSGELLRLPKNLYIWATMNTSDQSLFPIDSAFKRRWDWKYIPINTEKENWIIETKEGNYSWSSFLKEINREIGDTTSSEDKKLGFYFCKAENDKISAEKFVSKVLFYVYNDVFKDYGFESKEFFKKDGKVMYFQDYYNVDGTINEDNVINFLNNLKIEKSSESNNQG